VAQYQNTGELEMADTQQNSEAVIRRVPAFPRGRLGKTMRFLHGSHQCRFLDMLETAHAMYKRCPDLVTAATYLDKIPADMIEAYCSEYSQGPSENMGWRDSILLEPNYEQLLADEAREFDARRAAA